MTKPMNQTQEIDWGAVEGGNTEFAVQYPRLQWVHGEKKASDFMKVGGLFISAEQYPNFSADGFKPATLITNDGKEIEGFGASAAKLAVIRIKHQWIKEDQKNKPLAHVLCVVKGNEDLLCISLSGPTKALEFQKAFNQHIAQNVSVANRTRPQGTNPLEPFALWFPIKAGDYAPASSKDGKSNSVVTYPELVTPDTVDRSYVTTLWVGSDNYKKFASYFRDTAQWQKTPIWAQGANGESDLATQEQLEHLVQLADVKGYTEAELMEGTTHGERYKFTQLTRDEARQIIDTLAQK